MTNRTQLFRALFFVKVAVVVGAFGLRSSALASPGGSSVPSSSPLTIEVAQLSYLLEDGWAWARALGWAPGGLTSPGALLSAVLWSGDRARSAREKPHGLDLKRPVVLSADRRLQSVVLKLPVADAARFRSWLEELPAPSRENFELDGTQVWVLGPDTPRPLACVLPSESIARCQLGISGQGLLPLLSHLDPGSTGNPSWRGLPPGSRWRALVRPETLIRALATRMIAAQTRTRWMHPRVHGSSFAAKWTRAARLARRVDSIAFAFDVRESHGWARMVAQLTPEGERRLATWVPSTPVRRNRVRRWFHTPAAFRAYLQVRPRMATRLLRSVGLDLPASSLDGSMAILAFGLTDRCLGPQPPFEPTWVGTWASMIPSALAVGLINKAASVRVGKSLENQFGASTTSSLPDGVLRKLMGTIGRTPFEIFVLDRLMLGGTGPLGGHAALRRLRAPQRAGPHREEPSFLEAALDVGALAESLDLHRAGHAHGWLDAAGRHLSALALHLQRMEIRAARDGRRIALDMQLHR